MMSRDGFVVFDHDPRTAHWAEVARTTATRLAQDPKTRAANLRHGKTWFVGVDLLPNDAQGSVDGVPLEGPWQAHVPDLPLHAAQVSIVYPGYPMRDPDQSEANHRFRQTRMAAHVDGLLPEGPERRRFPRECHAYILGLPLNEATASPTVVWSGSHVIMQAALADAVADEDPRKVDVTDIYQAARRTVFEKCAPVPICARPGQSFLIHRFALHGTQPWDGPDGDGRMIAFFRPEFTDARQWLTAP
ncbi:hypothetical protein [Tateyamaria sp. ANG-S1]|uniref:hypothetical protein n=1 Tax=Tateyamaria sp. ANG-S1 TaxID=1577905 RepID=UPI00057DD7AF|nr:hypothetical protein [Tateyamaria sp. ANG-S1]KIC51321.1 hypothetical protein RA29_05715 [Tateyamaria sp. ANG-S1]